MASGGRRVGSGRPLKLDFQERLLVGASCEQRWKEAISQKEQDAYLKLKTSMPAVTRMQEEANSIPLHERKKWLRNTYSKEGYTLREDANFERRERAGIGSETDDDVVPYLITLPAQTRPKGLQNAIIADVLTEAQAEYPEKNITARFVRTCWDEYRAFVKSLDLI